MATMNPSNYELRINWETRVDVLSELRHLTSIESYSDTTLICKDGIIVVNRLAVGLIFPCLSKSFELAHFQEPRILLPDYHKDQIVKKINILFAEDLLTEVIGDENEKHTKEANSVNSNGFSAFRCKYDKTKCKVGELTSQKNKRKYTHEDLEEDHDYHNSGVADINNVAEDKAIAMKQEVENHGTGFLGNNVYKALRIKHEIEDGFEMNNSESYNQENTQPYPQQQEHTLNPASAEVLGPTSNSSTVKNPQVNTSTCIPQANNVNSTTSATKECKLCYAQLTILGTLKHLKEYHRIEKHLKEYPRIEKHELLEKSKYKETKVVKYDLICSVCGVRKKDIDEVATCKKQHKEEAAKEKEIVVDQGTENDQGKKFLCNVDNCTSKFTSKPSLHRHRRRVHQVSSLPKEPISRICSYCSKEYADIKGLKRHRLKCMPEVEPSDLCEKPQYLNMNLLPELFSAQADGD